MFPTIICPVDFSDHSQAALRYAVALAEHFGAKLVVVHANDPLLVGAAAVYQTDLLGDEARRELQDFLARVQADSAARTAQREIVLTIGHAASEILKVSQEREADLIVMGTHGLSGYRKMFFGSTTEQVLRRTTVPVLAVPLSEVESKSIQTPLLLAGPVLAPVDFSEASNRAAHVAAAVAPALGVPLILLHAIAPLRTVERFRQFAAGRDRLRVEEVRDQIAKLAASLATARSAETVVVTGDPAEEIARLSRERHTSLIVMGLRGVGVLLLSPVPGSIAYRVLCLAPAPVLAVPATGPHASSSYQSDEEAGAAETSHGLIAPRQGESTE